MARRDNETNNELLEQDVNIDFSPLWQDEEEGGLLRLLPTILAVINLILMIIILVRHKWNRFPCPSNPRIYGFGEQLF